MYAEKTHSGEFLLSEGNGQISREAIVLVPTATDLDAGTILMMNDDGKYMPVGEIDGEEGEDPVMGTASAILYSPASACEDEQMATAIVRLAEVVAVNLSGLTAQAGEDLKEHLIFIR